jgi:membrane carboxypeptidase/penicillin-binding protein
VKPGALLRRWYGRLGPRGRWLLLTAFLSFLGLGTGLAWGAWTHVCDDCPSIAQIYAFQPKEATRVFADDGSLLAELAVERRTAVAYRALPWYVPQAFVAIEDKRFWHHHGIDVLRTLRAGLEFALHGYDVAGGSTITQQLAGNMFPGAVNRQKLSIRRKLKEMHVALDLERAYTKQEILGAYLNQINFGRGHYGVQSAARWLFGEDARDLNLPEAALLAALPKAPERYSPVDHPERAVVRRNLVLQEMEDQGMIDRGTAEAAKAYPLALHRETENEGTAPYFVEWVRQQLMDRYGPQIYEAGLRVYTTLDPGIQSVADSALHAQLDWVEQQPGFQGPTFQATRNWPEEKLQGTEMPCVSPARCSSRSCIRRPSPAASRSHRSSTTRPSRSCSPTARSTRPRTSGANSSGRSPCARRCTAPSTWWRSRWGRRWARRPSRNTPTRSGSPPRSLASPPWPSGRRP